MDWDDYCRRFTEEAREQGKDEPFIRERLKYAEPLAKANLPIIYDVAHLSSLVGFEEEALRDAMSDSLQLYKFFPIPKRTVGYRWISKPVDSLMSIQKWILVHILNKRRPHDAATAFCRGRSIKQNAEAHLRQQMVLSLDVAEFFPSIRPRHVYAVFQQIGYSPEVADALTLLSMVKDGLPQGSPTSPALSNLVMIGVDECLTEYARTHSIRYSRYADDLTFSGKRFWVGRVIAEVRHSLKMLDLALNETKTRLMRRHQRQEVTGVVVNERLQALRDVRRSLRQEVYYIRKYGCDDHAQRRSSLYDTQKLPEHLAGLAEFVRSLNPADRDARAAIELLGRVRFQRASPGNDQEA